MCPLGYLGNGGYAIKVSFDGLSMSVYNKHVSCMTIRELELIVTLIPLETVPPDLQEPVVNRFETLWKRVVLYRYYLTPHHLLSIDPTSFVCDPAYI